LNTTGTAVSSTGDTLLTRESSAWRIGGSGAGFGAWKAGGVDMKISIRTTGDVQIVDMHGQLTIGKPEMALHDTVLGLVNDGYKKILINMKGVDRIDSAGLGEMVACRWRMIKKEGKIALVIPKGKVYEIFVISKLITIFDIFETEEEAIASF
jgi:anti-sigma B factor antagonist